MMNHGEVLNMQFAESRKHEETEFEKRLYNWVRWCTGDIGTFKRCSSIEGRFDAGNVFDEREAKIPIDSRDAEFFDRAYRELLSISDKAAFLVKAWFIHRTTEGKIARVVQCRLREVSSKLQASLKLLEICLHNLEKALYSGTYNLARL